MPRGHDVQRDIGLSLDVNYFLAVPRIAPSRGRFVLPLRIKFFDEIVFYCWPDVGESPADAPIVAHDNEWNSRQRYAGDVEVGGFRNQVRREPEVRRLVIEVHVVR